MDDPHLNGVENKVDWLEYEVFGINKVGPWWL
jgi:hypothetical protein